MKMITTKLRFFSIMDYDKEAEFLRTMHQQGWKLAQVRFPGFYQFMKSEAEDVVYQLDYSEARNENKASYIQLFEDCGWEYVLDFMGYSYFRKPAQAMDEFEQQEIFCDDESRLAMVKRIFRARVTPLVVLFLMIILPQIYTISQQNAAVSYLDLFYIGLFILYIVFFIRFVLKYIRFARQVRK